MTILCEPGLSTFGQGDAHLEKSCPQGYQIIATSFQHCSDTVMHNIPLAAQDGHAKSNTYELTVQVQCAKYDLVR